MSCFGGSIQPQRFLVPKHKRTTYKFIFGVVIVLEYKILNLWSFGDRLLWVSILVRKRLDLRDVLDVHFGRKRVWVPRHKRTTYKLIFSVVIVLEY